MPINYPGISFNNKGECSYCQGIQHYGVPKDSWIHEMIEKKDKLKNDFEKKIAEYKGLDTERCRIIHAAVMKGRSIKRYIERAHGRSTPYFDTLIHIEIVLMEE